MKRLGCVPMRGAIRVAPRRGAWVETIVNGLVRATALEVAPRRGAWVETS